MIGFLLILSFVVWYGVFRYRRRRMYQLAERIPKLTCDMPFFGCAHRLGGNTAEIMTTLQEFSFDSINNNGLVRAWLGHILYFILVDPVDLEVVLKTCLEKDDLHRFIRKVIGFGGIFAPVHIWRRRRKIMVPAFSPKNVENFVEILSEQADKLATQMAPHEGAGDFSAWPYLCSYTLDSVSETAMGVKINSQGNPDTPFLKSLATVLNLICERIFHLWLQPDWMYKLFPKYVIHQNNIKVMHTFVDQVIKNKRESMKSEKENQTEADHRYDIDSYGQKSFLDLLISLSSSGGEKGYTNRELREEVLTLTIAGTDTSAVCIGFTLKLLAKYPHVQDKVYQELYDVFGNSDRLLVKEDLVKLRYLERVIKESMRLFPPVPFVIRKVLQELKLPSGRVLPAGSGIVVSIWGVHRDPKYWGIDADKFDPDRFSPERYKLAHPCSFMPFSNGPRNCVGYQYAMFSIKTALTAILRRYRVVGIPETSTTPHLKVKIDIMLKDTDGYQVSLERRSPVKIA